jgi:hypothetical protein
MAVKAAAIRTKRLRHRRLPTAADGTYVGIDSHEILGERHPRHFEVVDADVVVERSSPCI